VETSREGPRAAPSSAWRRRSLRLGVGHGVAVSAASPHTPTLPLHLASSMSQADHRAFSLLPAASRGVSMRSMCARGAAGALEPLWSSVAPYRIYEDPTKKLPVVKGRVLYELIASGGLTIGTLSMEKGHVKVATGGWPRPERRAPHSGLGCLADAKTPMAACRKTRVADGKTTAEWKSCAWIRATCTVARSFKKPDT